MGLAVSCGEELREAREELCNGIILISLGTYRPWSGQGAEKCVLTSSLLRRS